MVHEDQLTAVIDFGYSSIIGDRRMNAMVAAAHLVTPRITPTITADDQSLSKHGCVNVISSIITSAAYPGWLPIGRLQAMMWSSMRGAVQFWYESMQIQTDNI